MTSCTFLPGRTFLFLSLVFAVLCPYDHGFAQAFDTWGREFRLTFMPNLGSGDVQEVPTLLLYIASRYPTTATITYHRNGDEIIDVDVPGSNTPVEVDLNSLFGSAIELRDVKDVGEISTKSLRITSPDEIAICGIDIRRLSADAFIVLPTDLLSYRYMVMAYENGFTINGKKYDTPSQFAIVATEDGTDISITPSALINARGDRATFPIKLDAGEVFLGQANLDTNSDVTGTDIRASKPVAVFAGCKRGGIPRELGNYRDLMVEQILPIDLWDTVAIVAPFYPIDSASTSVALARIISEADSTEWTLDGVPQPHLRRGQPVDIRVDSAHFIAASDRILVAQFEHSGGPADGTEPYMLGDPFMTFMPPPRGFDTDYVFQSIDRQEFSAHFITVVAPLGTRLVLDGEPIADTLTTVPTTRYGYARIEVSAGGHRIVGDSAFGLIVYGFGRATSYGYPGGMILTRRPLTVEQTRPAPGLSLTAAPNPVTATAMLRLSIRRPTTVAIALYDESGAEVLTVPAEETFEIGVHTIEVDLSSLPNGTYVCRGTTADGHACSCRIIVHR